MALTDTWLGMTISKFHHTEPGNQDELEVSQSDGDESGLANRSLCVKACDRGSITNWDVFACNRKWIAEFPVRRKRRARIQAAFGPSRTGRHDVGLLLRSSPVKPHKRIDKCRMHIKQPKWGGDHSNRRQHVEFA